MTFVKILMVLVIFEVCWLVRPKPNAALRPPEELRKWRMGEYAK